MKIVLLGAGHIGHTISHLLVNSGDYQLTVVDQAQTSLDKLKHLNIKTVVLDSDKAASLEAILKGNDAVINALPYHLATRVAQAAKNAGCHYFDLTEDVAATKSIMALAKDAKTAFMPQCGLAPGFIGIVAHHLPAFPTNALKYNLTWSVDGLINEYCHPCEAIHGGEVTAMLPLEGLEHFSLDGVEYEAFNTSGGLGTLCETLNGKVRNLDYKSVRYPGHRELMQFLLSDLRLSGDQETLKDIMRKSVPTTMQDVVLVFVTVSGMKNGAYVQEVFARKIFAQRAGKDNKASDSPLSAIQITTAAGICAAVDLFREGKLPKAGFVRQEEVRLPDFLANRFGIAYEQSRRIESIS
jgi:saccharopine dehydrogenase-like NADP-dependent oxidoreductase